MQHAKKKTQNHAGQKRMEQQHVDDCRGHAEQCSMQKKITQKLSIPTIGIGAGQPSRLDSCKLAIQKARQFQSEKIENSIAASDAFFPFADGIKKLIKAGVKIVVQPGGSIRDQEIIEAANKAKIKMIFTGTRHFNH